MKFIIVGGRHINTARIDSILLPDETRASVWFAGKAEPLHTSNPGEVAEIKRYVSEAMF